MGTHNHVDVPGKIHFFAGHGPAPVLGPCPHTACMHNAQAVVAWGPDWERYELMRCDAPDGCNGTCRGWRVVKNLSDSRQRVRRWLHVGEETPLPRDARDIEV